MRLKEIRIKRGLTQKDLSEKLKIKQNTISGYEIGVANPSIENLIKIADILDVSIDTLLGHDSEIIDLNVLSENQKQVVNIITKEMEDNDVAKVLGYIDNLRSK